MKGKSTQNGQGAAVEAPREVVRNRILNVLRLIRRNGTPEESIAAAQWEQMFADKNFDPTAITPLKAA